MRIDNNYNRNNSRVGFNASFTNEVKCLLDDTVKGFEKGAERFLSENERFVLENHDGPGQGIVYGRLRLDSDNPKISGIPGNRMVLGAQEGDTFRLTPGVHKIAEREMLYLDDIAQKRLHEKVY